MRDPEMRLAARPGAGMAGMEMRLVDDMQAVRLERLGEFFLNSAT